ncbi:hypothetical protein J6TS2_29200 [Heyndrickxia sporothermodurans]|nr:hypothetical protein J6TS2_29200 [Heyndrickxia sporothermodurans]
MEELKRRIEKLENLVEDLILMLGRSNQKVINLSLQTSHLEKLLQENQNITMLKKNVS